MGPNLESCALTRGKCAYVAALIPQALIDKLQIIERYNHRTKRCRVLSQDDGTSSSDRRAIECPKAGNVRKTRQCAHRSPSACSSTPEAAVPAGSTAGHPGRKAWQMPATAQQAPHPQADDSFAICWIGSPNGTLLKIRLVGLRCRSCVQCRRCCQTLSL
jgi:hypothetical protein